MLSECCAQPALQGQGHCWCADAPRREGERCAPRIAPAITLQYVGIFTGRAISSRPRCQMTTIAVVRKNGYAAIAADTMTKWGTGKETASYIVNHGKIFQVGNTYSASPATPRSRRSFATTSRARGYMRGSTAPSKFSRPG